MVSNSKILTVSYGTFSCTLEGFDDSFDTMKAIAEYFRDLAADDRYFGAEPPSPDAEMLARIAEREISRRVEAHGTGGAYHLKAGPSALTSQPAADDAAPAPQQTANGETGEPTAPQPAAEAAPSAAAPEMPADAAFMPAPAAAPSRPSAPASESIADKLRRIRAVAAPAAGNAPGFDEDEHAQDFLTGAPEDDAIEEETPLEGVDAPTFETAEEPAQAAPEAAETERAEVEPPKTEQSPIAEIEAAQGSLQSTDAQDEAEGSAPAQDEPLAPWDEAPQEVDLDSMEDEFEPEEEIEAQPEIAAEDPAGAASDEESDDDILSRLSQTQDEGASTGDKAISAEPDATEALGPIDAPEAEMATDDGVDDEAEQDDAVISGDDDANIFGDDGDVTAEDDAGANGQNDTLAQLLADAMTPDEADKADAFAQQNAAEPDMDEAGEAEDDRPLAARVFKMKRADLDAALDGGDFEEDMENAGDEASLSPEAEAELLRELAEVEAELQHARAPETALDAVRPDAPESVTDETAPDETAVDEDDEEDAFASLSGNDDEDESDAPKAAEAAGRAKHFDTPAPDAQAARIFDEADTQLGEPASNERRSAIQHLRAAVAATRAERRAGGAMQPDVDDRPYRDDLQTAVRPRRPRPMASGATPRPSAAAPQRPAPLKLVAEQRIDIDAAPVRPRRITRADLVPAPEAGKRPEADDAPGFAVFAEQMGASSLTEMLEAAAAYMADVEGMPQFSRPMLMQKLREAQDEEFSREDGLRSFGQLLRQGKLQKLKGGRFAVTEVTEFRQSA